MYAVIKNDNVIAIHDKLETVEKFIKQEKNNDMEIIKIKKKKKSRKLYEKYSNLYLVRYGDRYIPQELFETIEKEDKKWQNRKKKLSSRLCPEETDSDYFNHLSSQLKKVRCHKMAFCGFNTQ